MISPIPLTTLLLLVPSFALAGTAHRKRRSCHRKSTTSLAPAATQVSPLPTLPVISDAPAPASTQVSAVVDSSTVASGAGQWTLKVSSPSFFSSFELQKTSELILPSSFVCSQETMIGNNFLDSFTFDTFDDPTHGVVE